MKVTKPILAASILCFSAFSFGAHAQSTMTDKQIKANYKAADKACSAMKGDQKDACQTKAKADRDSAMADAKLNRKTAEARHDASKDKNAAQYKAAVAQCDTMSGDSKDACKAEAKTKFNK
jgi:hypothetical protein